MYGGLNHGRIDVDRLRTALAGLPPPQFDGGRPVLAVDVDPHIAIVSDAGHDVTRLACLLREGKAEAQAWDRVHPRLTHRSAWLDHDGELPLVEGTLIRLKVGHLSKGRDAPPLWLWSSRTGATPDDVDRFWQASLRRFDLEHTFRFAQQTLGARPLATDLRRPWEKPTTSDRLTPARVRRGFRNIRAHLACPTRVPKPRGAGPGRPPGAKNKHRAPCYDIGKTAKPLENLKAIGKPGRSW